SAYSASACSTILRTFARMSLVDQHTEKGGLDSVPARFSLIFSPAKINQAFLRSFHFSTCRDASPCEEKFNARTVEPPYSFKHRESPVTRPHTNPALTCEASSTRRILMKRVLMILATAALASALAVGAADARGGGGGGGGGHGGGFGGGGHMGGF